MKNSFFVVTMCNRRLHVVTTNTRKLGKNKPGSAQFTSRLLQIGLHQHNVAIIVVTLS